MIASILLGAIAGSRSLTPLAAVSTAAAQGRLPPGLVARVLGHPATSKGLMLLAAGELLGDKWRRAPDRIVAAGMAARVASAALSGWAVAKPGEKGLSALLAVAASIGMAHFTFSGRMASMERSSQMSTGLVEDALALAATGLVLAPAVGERR